MQSSSLTRRVGGVCGALDAFDACGRATLAVEQDESLYVAGKWSDRERVGALIRGVERDYCARITYMWPDDEHASLSDAARNEIAGVHACDTFIALMDDADYAYRGTFTELGAALALDKRIIIVGSAENACATNCFWHHPEIEHCATLDEAARHSLRKRSRSAICELSNTHTREKNSKKREARTMDCLAVGLVTARLGLFSNDDWKHSSWHTMHWQPESTAAAAMRVFVCLEIERTFSGHGPYVCRVYRRVGYVCRGGTILVEESGQIGNAGRVETRAACIRALDDMLAANNLSGGAHWNTTIAVDKLCSFSACEY